MKLFEFFFRKREHWQIKFVVDEPDTIKANIFYLIGEDNIWLAAFACPCGCKELIKLNMLQADYPRWTYRYFKKKVNIYPSIKRIRGCSSHFIVRNSRIIFVDDYLNC